MDETKQQQVIELKRLGWSLRRIEAATGVRRETISGYLKGRDRGVPREQPSRRFLRLWPLFRALRDPSPRHLTARFARVSTPWRAPGAHVEPTEARTEGQACVERWIASSGL